MITHTTRRAIIGSARARTTRSKICVRSAKITGNKTEQQGQTKLRGQLSFTQISMPRLRHIVALKWLAAERRFRCVDGDKKV